ncbi:MAG: ankyrin repeat domain-containing protein [Thermoguttaceae bacterium]|nr:ankyrin repeat domain-containing protein [Thermoguttaceae bacterium]MBR6436158.1 ankyrin repeat domain-containing protein [Thermoguttaceae bacterium]
MINGKSLTFAFILMLIVSITLNAAENSVRERSVKDAETAFGKSAVDRFEQMFQSGNFDFKTYGYRGVTVLRYVVFMNDFERVKLLIEKGADVNARDNRDITPLMAAADNNNLEIVKYLVENGADVNAQDDVEDVALFFAAQNGNLEMVQYLIENGADITVEANRRIRIDYTALHCAARSGNLELVQWLVNQGISVIKSDGVLHKAVLSGNLELVKWLVAQGADVNSYFLNDSVLAYAVDCSNMDVMRYLVEQEGVDVNESVNRKVYYPALECAVKHNNFESVKFLVEHGANINPPYILGKFPTPGWYFLCNADPEIVEYLRERDTVLKGLSILGSLIFLAALMAFIYFVYRMVRPKKSAETELSSS